MKKIVALALAALLSVSMLGLLAACGRGASDIKSITTSSNESNGVDVTVYRVNLNDSVDWAALSESDREKIAAAGFDEAQKKIAEAGVFNYQILGYSTTEPESTIFQFDGSNQTVVIYVAKEKVGEIAVEVPNR